MMMTMVRYHVMTAANTNVIVDASLHNDLFYHPADLGADLHSSLEGRGAGGWMGGAHVPHV